MRAIYTADTEGVVALGAATVAKTIFGVKGNTGHAIDLLSWGFSLDGTSATEKPVFVEFCTASFATNAPGTASTSVTVDPYAGPRIAQTFTAAKSWSTEPTALVTVGPPLDADPYKFWYERDYQWGEGPDFNVAEGIAIRMTIPSGGAAVNARVWAKWARV